MSEEDHHDASKASSRSDSAAWGALSAASREKADAFLDEQTILARLQAKELAHELALRHWSIRFSNLSAVMKVAFEIAVALIMVSIAVFIGGAVWSAFQSDGLVIEAFSTPPELAQKGLTGPVIAAKLLDRLTAMQEVTHSARTASSFKNNWTSDIKVDIPDTGVSLGQAVDYLHGWLGHEQHLTGELVEVPNGIALTARLGGEPGDTVTGTNLDVLVQKAAEAVFRRAQPYRYSRYLSRFVDRRPESVAVMQVLTKSGNITDRVWSWAGLSLTWAAYGAFPRSLDDARRAQALDPQSAVPYQSLQNLYYDLGQSEEELAADRAMSERTRSAGTSSISLRTLPVLHAQADAWTAELLGDYQAALRLDNAMAQMPDYQGSASIAPFNAAIDFAWAHDGNQARAALASADPESDPYSPSAAEFAWGLIRLGIGDWRGVIAHMTQSEQDRDIAAKAADPRADTRHYHRVDTGPQIALALAMLGEKAKTAAMLKTLPLDCYVCTRMRGRIDAEHMNWGGATYWFVEAIRQGPSLPFAYADWGAMLLRKGDYDAAIAKFRAANLKGPQFADPLEMWGEALMLKNRSDLALAKFEEANKHAPNWGRLHLKWGEALFYAGRQDEARKQFGQAANLDLSASDQSELARVRHG